MDPNEMASLVDDLLRSGVITPRPGKTKVYIGPPNANNGSRKSKNPPGSIYLPVVGNGYLFNEREDIPIPECFRSNFEPFLSFVKSVRNFSMAVNQTYMCFHYIFYGALTMTDRLIQIRRVLRKICSMNALFKLAQWLLTKLNLLLKIEGNKPIADTASGEILQEEENPSDTIKKENEISE